MKSFVTTEYIDFSQYEEHSLLEPDGHNYGILSYEEEKIFVTKMKSDNPKINGDMIYINLN